MKQLCISAVMLLQFGASDCMSQTVNYETIGYEFIAAVFRHDYKSAYTYFGDNLKSKVTEETLGKTIDQLEHACGTFQRVNDITKRGDLYFYNSTFAKGMFDLKIAFDSASKIKSFLMGPHQDTVANEKSDHSKSKSLKIKCAGAELPGTLIQPVQNDRKTLVIFVHGSGPNDRDETVGPNKFFKQLADSIVISGISSFRYDKKTLAAPELFYNKSFTVDDEVTSDVINIVRYFSENNEFKNYKIYVLGHSLGAYLMPRVAGLLQDTIAGIVMMAAPALPLEDLLLDQYNFINSVAPSKEMDEEIKKTKTQVDFLHSPSFGINSPADKLPLNMPASYWLSLRHYDHLNTIKEVRCRILILQGTFDYQVTMKDFDLWKDATAKKDNCEMNSYPALNHSFMKIPAKSSLASNVQPGQISTSVVHDLERWMLK